MLVIRLARGGRHKYPTYRIVAADKRRAATSKFVAVLGSYNPHTKQLVIKKEEIIEFMSQGAQPSNRVAILLQKEGVELPKWVEIATRNRAPKKAEENEEKVAEVAQDSTETVADEATTVDQPETAASGAQEDAAGETAQESAAAAAEAATDQAETPKVE